MTELRYYTEVFAHLHTAKMKGHRAPHKAVLLIAIIDLIDDKKITSQDIELTDLLVNKFNQVWKRYLGTSSIFTPDIAKPFFHMQHESFWRLVEVAEIESAIAAEPSPYVESSKEKKDLPVGSYSVKAMRSAFAYAQIDNNLFYLLQNPDARAMLRVILINEYLTNQPTKSMPDLQIIMAALPLLLLVA